MELKDFSGDAGRRQAGPPPTKAPTADLEPTTTEVVEISVSGAVNAPGTISNTRAKRFIERLQRGEKVSEAAKNSQISTQVLRDANHPIRQEVEGLLSKYFLPAEARRQLNRAFLNKTVLAGMADDADATAQKLALDAANQMAQDPETGLRGTDQSGVVIDLGALANVFAALQNAKAPEVIDVGVRGSLPSGETEIRDGDIEIVGSESDTISDVSTGSAVEYRDQDNGLESADR